MFLFPVKNKNYYLPHILGKPVIDIELCENLTDAIILVSFWEYDEAKENLDSYGLSHLLVRIENLSDIISESENVVVYGTGGRARRFYQDVKHLLSVKKFCDSNVKKAGDIFEGCRIIKPSELQVCPKGTVVIIASTYIDEIYSTVLENGIPENSIFAVPYESEFRFQVKGLNCKNWGIKESDLHAIVRDTKNKRIVVYGYRAVIEVLLPKLEILGISPVELVVRDILEEDGTIYNLPILDDKNTVILLLDQYSDKLYTALVEMEVEEKQMVWFWNHGSFYVSNKQKYYEVALDPNCGHAYLGEGEKYPGFISYQYENMESCYKAIKILTLGGSTTSAYGAKNSSWSEKLSLLLKEYGISHVLYCGGVDAYSASNELIKLIRDGIWLKPDLVINYSGANNENRCDVENMFLNTYQEILFKNLAGKISIDSTGNVKQVYYGIHPKVNDYEYWYIQMKVLHGVCSSLGIHHRAFLQPILFNKKRYYESDADIAMLWNSFFDKSLGEYVAVDAPVSYCSLLQKAKMFEKMEKDSEDLWLDSLTDIFDEEEEVYMDYAHVYEKGNEIIANKIFEKIKEELQLMLKERK